LEEHIAEDKSPKTAWGHTLQIRPRLGERWLSLSPLWAVLAGALSASATWVYSDLLRVLTVVILVEASYEAITAAVGWQRGVQEAADEAGGWRDWLPWLPYSSSGSPSGWLARLWGRLLGAWRANRWTGKDGVLAQMGVNLLIAGVLSAYLGWPAVWAMIAIVALGMIHHLLGPAQATVGRWALAIGAIFVPWILAGALFGVLSEMAIVVGLLYTIARGALIDRGRLVDDRASLIVAGASQLIVAGILVAVKQPLAAGVLIVLLAAQVLLQVGPRRVDVARRLARVQPLVVLGMLLAGWALRA